ncbi:putative signal transduction protein [Caldicellulosiruptor hydrothermalis 108]|uniref:Putative signal transduction protein n=1 Tax=Caldicellulosiruptor hydrothermalis (strain DSM 18901 / VKM B-2411 / 108) TaxID=632292 RepID=E4QD98_CALH1|nr:response regulator [Caldicellulosiruptor hydrothermalis]ADQ06393.1 putative signal transduction protein [Caldicellulosiruptor hydrothermalis 108]
MKKSILFVDDEKNILRALYRVFCEEDYNLFFAESAKEALDVLESNDMDIIITDFRMPGMSGYDLLKVVKEKYPHVIRIILSGYADENIVFKALQTNVAKVYILKPWNNEELKEIIKNVIELEDKMRENRCLEIINNIDYLPTLKNLYSTICKVIENEDDINKVVKIIEQDPAIASKILQIANSAFYNLKTASVKQAVVYLGLVNVRNIVLNAAVFECVGDGDYKTLLWEHANLTNKIFYYIYERILGKKVQDSFASAGLLHGIGQILLLKLFPQKYKEYRKRIMYSDQYIDFEELEKEIFGFTHTELGAVLLSWWDIPLPVVEAAFYHHKPNSNNIINREIVCAVNIACYLAWDLAGVKQSEEHVNYSKRFLKLDCDNCVDLKQLYENLFNKQEN